MFIEANLRMISCRRCTDFEMTIRTTGVPLSIVTCDSSIKRAHHGKILQQLSPQLVDDNGKGAETASALRSQRWLNNGCSLLSCGLGLSPLLCWRS